MAEVKELFVLNSGNSTTASEQIHVWISPDDLAEFMDQCPTASFDSFFQTVKAVSLTFEVEAALKEKGLL